MEISAGNHSNQFNTHLMLSMANGILVATVMRERYYRTTVVTPTTPTQSIFDFITEKNARQLDKSMKLERIIRERLNMLKYA